MCDVSEPLLEKIVSCVTKQLVDLVLQRPGRFDCAQLTSYYLMSGSHYLYQMLMSKMTCLCHASNILSSVAAAKGRSSTIMMCA